MIIKSFPDRTKKIREVKFYDDKGEQLDSDKIVDQWKNNQFDELDKMGSFILPECAVNDFDYFASDVGLKRIHKQAWEAGRYEYAWDIDDGWTVVNEKDKQKIRSKYLKVTIRDNDFKIALKAMCDMLYHYLEEFYGYPTEKDLPKLKKYIKSILFGIVHVGKISNNSSFSKANDEVPEDYFEPILEFVDYFDIPDWDNGESAYIPMFDDGKVLIR